jgi:hypothetical protein
MHSIFIERFYYLVIRLKFDKREYEKLPNYTGLFFSTDANYWKKCNKIFAYCEGNNRIGTYDKAADLFPIQQ